MSDADRRVVEAERLTRIEEKIDRCLREVMDTREYVQSVSQRVRALEIFRGAVLAVASFAGMVAGYFKWGGN